MILQCKMSRKHQDGSPPPYILCVDTIAFFLLTTYYVIAFCVGSYHSMQVNNKSIHAFY